MKVEYKVLCTENNQQRIDNVGAMKTQLPPLKIIMSGRDGLFERFVSLFNLSSGFDGLVILEDDVRLCKDFQRRCEELILSKPYEVISMFESACSKGELHSEYRNGGRYQWNQCNYFPKSVCNELVKKSNVEAFRGWYKTKYSVWTYPSDTYIGYVLGKMKLKYWMQVPFLVQHLDFKSTLGPRPTNRQSRFFIDDVEAKND